MSYSGLDHPRSPLYYLFYKIVFVCLIIGTGFLLYYAAAQVKYNWSWSRLPNYFWIQGTQDVQSNADGRITAINQTPKQITIEITTPAKDIRSMTLPGNALLAVKEQTEIFYGDALGNYTFSKPGLLLEGLWVTVVVSVYGIIGGICLGMVTGLCRISDNPALKWGAITYIEIIRGSPLLVQIFLWYFVMGFLIDAFLQKMGVPAIPPLWYGIIALSIFTGAYVAEIVRAGIQSVHRGQMEAARSLGLSHAKAMRKVILPQAFRRILPPLAGQFISLIKDSSLLGVMGVRELTKGTRESISSSMLSLELWFTCAILYLFLTFILSLFVQYLERRAVR